MKNRIWGFAFCLASQLAFGQTSFLTIQGTEQLRPGDSALFICFENRYSGGTPSAVWDATWTFEDFNPTHAAYGNYLEWNMGKLKAKDFIPGEFDCYVKCTYRDLSARMRVTVLPSKPQLKYQNNGYVVWWMPEYIRNKTIAHEFAQAVVIDATTKFIFEKMAGIASKLPGFAASLILSILIDMPSVGPPTTINMQLTTETGTTNIANVETGQFVFYHIYFQGGQYLTWVDGLKIKISKQKEPGEYYNPRSGFEAVTTFDVLNAKESNETLSSSKYLILPKKPLRFNAAGVYKIEIITPADAGTRVCYVQVHRPREQGEISSIPQSIFLILDTSGSMSDRISGSNISKLSAAKLALYRLFERNMGNRAHTEWALMILRDCGNAPIIQDFTTQKEALLKQIRGLGTYSATPLAYSILQAANYINENSKSSENQIILLTDGMETCGGDPIEAARRIGLQYSSADISGIWDLLSPIPQAYAAPIGKSGKKIKLNVVVLDSTNTAQERQLKSIAAAAHGKYFQADNMDELSNALEKAAGLDDNWKIILIVLFLILLMGSIGASVYYLVKDTKKKEPASLPMDNAPVSLLTAEIKGKTFSYPLFPNRSVSIGRNVSNNIVIQNKYVSDRHASIEYSTPDKKFKLTDQGSTNSTFFRGQKIKEADLTLGDEFRIYKYTFRIVPYSRE